MRPHLALLCWKTPKQLNKQGSRDMARIVGVDHSFHHTRHNSATQQLRSCVFEQVIQNLWQSKKYIPNPKPKPQIHNHKLHVRNHLDESFGSHLTCTYC